MPFQSDVACLLSPCWANAEATSPLRNSETGSCQSSAQFQPLMHCSDFQALSVPVKTHPIPRRYNPRQRCPHAPQGPVSGGPPGPALLLRARERRPGAWGAGAWRTPSSFWQGVLQASCSGAPLGPCRVQAAKRRHGQRAVLGDSAHNGIGVAGPLHLPTVS